MERIRDWSDKLDTYKWIEFQRDYKELVVIVDELKEKLKKLENDLNTNSEGGGIHESLHEGCCKQRRDTD